MTTTMPSGERRTAGCLRASALRGRGPRRLRRRAPRLGAPVTSAPGCLFATGRRVDRTDGVDRARAATLEVDPEAGTIDSLDRPTGAAPC